MLAEAIPVLLLPVKEFGVLLMAGIAILYSLCIFCIMSRIGSG